MTQLPEAKSAFPHTTALIEVPGENEGDWEDRPNGWQAARSSVEQLAALNTRMYNVERELRGLRTEAKDGREELRFEVRSKFDEIKGAKADAYRISNIEGLLAARTEEFNKALAGKANAWHLNMVSAVVFGFVCIILVAVANNLLSGHATVFVPAPVAGRP
jgi:hypothetical protein